MVDIPLTVLSDISFEVLAVPAPRLGLHCTGLQRGMISETLFKIQRFDSEITDEQLGTSLNRGKLRRKHAGTRRGDMAPEPHARC